MIPHLLLLNQWKEDINLAFSVFRYMTINNNYRVSYHINYYKYYIEHKNGQPIFRTIRFFVRCYSFLLFFNSGDFIHTFCMATAFKFSVQPNVNDI